MLQLLEVWYTRWYVHGQTLAMQWQLLAGLCQILVKLIGKQLNEFWDIYEAPQKKCLHFSKRELKIQGYV